MAGKPEFEPVTEEEKDEARRAVEQLKRDLADAAKRPRPAVYSPGKFTDPLGLDESGNLQPPLTPEEADQNETIRRRARRGEAGESPDDAE